jgi:hypothetical protein
MIVLIGSHPKGFDEPFHPTTRSGKILRNIIGKNPSYIFYDIWQNETEQKSGQISNDVLEKLNKFIASGYRLIALGRIVQNALASSNIPFECLPHPASRRKADQVSLRTGLGSHKTYKKTLNIP